MSTYLPSQLTGDRLHPGAAVTDPGTVEAWETDGGAVPRAEPTAGTAAARPAAPSAAEVAELPPRARTLAEAATANGWGVTVTSEGIAEGVHVRTVNLTGAFPTPTTTAELTARCVWYGSSYWAEVSERNGRYAGGFGEFLAWVREAPAMCRAGREAGWIRPGSPLPGTELEIVPLPQWYDGAPRERIAVRDARMYARYTQTIHRNDTGVPVREAPGYGQPHLSGGAVRAFLGGGAVRAFLGGSLGFWLSSQATITDDETIIYRQTNRHSAITFTPDRESGVIITHPERYITADAYRVTGHGRLPQVWTQAAVREAVSEATRPGPIDWPDGWALLMPDESVRFAPRGFPWKSGDVYIAEPTAPPQEWGPRCGTCDRYATEHDPARGWGRRCSAFQPPTDS
ncbi:hypothetical protein ACFWPQ_40730 [Streptomyces sp. NPDC058464]|uniref:hypothetical protein n=1 Tax=Streptomyces sp. NPDC058464 TaxID=3346511 RepID=UPI003662009D